MLLLVSAAFAWESPAVDVVLEDETLLFDGISYSSGWVPSSSPVQAKFEVIASGGTWVEMEGESFLYWPEAVTHGYDPYPQTGLFLLDQELGVDVSFRIDVAGVQVEIPVANVTQVYEDEVVFDPWLLDDGTGEPIWAEVESSGAATELVNQSFNLYTGVSAYIAVDWRSDIYNAFTGVQFDSNGSLITQEGETELFDPPEDGVLVLDSVFTGRYRTQLDLVMVPTFGVCIDLLGCYDIASFDIPIPLVDDEFDQEFDALVIEHGVPLLEVDTEVCDFGETLVGQISHCEIALTNLGGFDVEGSAGILGTGEFSIWPEDLLARPETTDGITITFAPTSVGEQSASLILNTSDPSKEALEIQLVGVGYEEPEELTVITSETGCGCASTQGGAGGALAVMVLAAAALRRR